MSACEGASALSAAVADAGAAVRVSCFCFVLLLFIFFFSYQVCVDFFFNRVCVMFSPLELLLFLFSLCFLLGAMFFY